jgi:hypothetical protein
MYVLVPMYVLVLVPSEIYVARNPLPYPRMGEPLFRALRDARHAVVLCGTGLHGKLVSGTGSGELRDDKAKAGSTLLTPHFARQCSLGSDTLRAPASRPMPSRQDAAASKITAGVKGLHTRKQLKAGNVERFTDGDRERKINDRKQRAAKPLPRALPPLPLDAHMALASLLHSGHIKCANCHFVVEWSMPLRHD